MMASSSRSSNRSSVINDFLPRPPSIGPDRTGMSTGVGKESKLVAVSVDMALDGPDESGPDRALIGPAEVLAELGPEIGWSLDGISSCGALGCWDLGSAESSFGPDLWILRCRRRLDCGNHGA